MIRVLHVIASMNIGGAETFIMNVYRNIDRSKVQFDFLLHTDKNCAYNSEIISLGGKIFSIPSRNQGVLKNHYALNRFFKRNPKYRIVHQHLSSLSYIEPLKIASRYGVPIRILHSHSTREGGSILHKYIHNVNKLSVKKYATHYFACSDLAAKWIIGKKQYNAKEFTIINNGIETENFIYNTNIRKSMRDKLGIGDKFVVGHIGNFVYPKNHVFLIDIFKVIHQKDIKSILILVGDGKLRNEIEEKIINEGLKDSVILTGVRKDIPNLLQAMDVFIMPSFYEGLPVTLVEAQAAGLN